MQIACLGWGSLTWERRDLPIQDDWQHNGPWLPIEFARQSRDDRITLVCVPGTPRVQSLWVYFISATVDAAREALRKREGVSKNNIARHIGVWTPDRPISETSLNADIGAWASDLNLNAVIWTNLPPKFQGEDGKIPTAEEVIRHLSGLSGKKRQDAEQYIRMTPRQIRTPYRAHIEQALHWFPDARAI